MYKASVVIPVYNAEKTIRRCVESILFGRESDVQIVLIDDCSTDQSWKECSRLQKQYAQVMAIHNDKNRGVSFTRNRGLTYAQAESVLFVDGDDWVSGEYVSSLLEMSQSHPAEMVLCGYTLIDYTRKQRSRYIFGGQSEIVHVSNLFDLEGAVLLQQLWNKVFHREIIRRANIQFDESLSMGEDFKFVLDYMEAAGLHQCAVLNRPLYYYIRANQTSLMSKWIDVPFDVRMGTYRMLAERMEDSRLAQKEYMLVQQRLVYNLIYQIMNSPSIGWKEKGRKLREYVPRNAGYSTLLHSAKGIVKERIYNCLTRIRELPVRLYRKVIREQVRPRIRAYRRRKLRSDDFSIIAQNCIGGVFYHEMGMQFLSPTVNLFFQEPDFMCFVTNLDYYLGLDLCMQWGEEYPIGFLDDVRIDFMHYDTCEEAKEAWERRKVRIRKDRIVVIATDRNGFDDACFEQWKNLPYRKILYTANRKYAAEPGSVYYSTDEENGYVSNVIDNLAFYKDDVIFDVVNSLD